MMVFDSLCKVAEGVRNERLKQLCKDARIFRFEKGKKNSQWEPEELIQENIRCPFPVICIEYSGRDGKGDSCVLLMPKEPCAKFEFVAMEQSSERQQIAMGVIQFLPEGCVNFKNNPKDALLRMFRIEEFRTGDISGEHIDWSDSLTANEVSRLFRESIYKTDCPAISGDDLPLLKAPLLISKPVQRETWTTGDSRELVQLITKMNEAHGKLKNLGACVLMMVVARTMEDILQINSPSSFIVEECPLNTGNAKSPGSIERSPWRSHFIVLTPGEIRSKLQIPKQIQSGTRACHERRGHWRRYLSDKFVNLKGQKRWIEAFWIGPKESTLGPNKYIVRTDL